MSEFLPVGIGGRWALRESFTRCHGTHMEGPTLGLNTIEVEGPVGKTLREAEQILNQHDGLVEVLTEFHDHCIDQEQHDCEGVPGGCPVQAALTKARNP